MESIQPEIVEEATPTQEEPVKTQAPITDVGTFWERLDEVLQLVKSGGTVNTKLDSILETFEETAQINQTPYRSFLFQPERIAISSNNDLFPPLVISQDSSGTFQNIVYSQQPSQYFSSFRIRFQRPLLSVKSIQLLSAVIPNAIQNIPDNSTVFFYYRLNQIENASLGIYNPTVVYNRGDIVQTLTVYYNCLQNNTLNVNPTTNPQAWASMGTDGTRPNYYELVKTDPPALQYVRLLPSNLPPEEFAANQNPEQFINRSYDSYEDLLTSLNRCAATAVTASIPGDVTFQYNVALKKFQFVPQDTETYYYMIAGFEDPLVSAYLTQVIAKQVPYVDWVAGYTLNLRLGFTWNGIFPNPYIQNPYAYSQGQWRSSFANIVRPYLRPIDPYLTAVPPAISAWKQDLITANSYGDLVNTNCIRIYTDVTLGSTEDSDLQGGLLSLVPVNTTNLGVAFYQNNFNNPLTKIPRILPEISIRLVNDQGLPYYLPNSATVLLELAMEYY